MELGGYRLEGLFFDSEEVKDLPGVYVVLSVRVLDVGESGHTYRTSTPRGYTKPLYIRARLRNHDRRSRWEENRGQGEIAYAVIYEPNDERRGQIEEDLRKKLNPVC